MVSGAGIDRFRGKGDGVFGLTVAVKLFGHDRDWRFEVLVSVKGFSVVMRLVDDRFSRQG